MTTSQTNREFCEIEAAIHPPIGAPISCIIVDISATGAGLDLPSDVVLPIVFTLRGALSFGGTVDEEVTERVVRLRWQQQRKAGVSFIAS